MVCACVLLLKGNMQSDLACVRAFVCSCVRACVHNSTNRSRVAFCYGILFVLAMMGLCLIVVGWLVGWLVVAVLPRTCSIVHAPVVRTNMLPALVFTGSYAPSYLRPSVQTLHV